MEKFLITKYYNVCDCCFMYFFGSYYDNAFENAMENVTPYYFFFIFFSKTMRLVCDYMNKFYVFIASIPIWHSLSGGVRILWILFQNF